MKHSFRLCAWGAFLLSLVLTVAGCGASPPHPGAQFYRVTQEGIKVPCDPNGAIQSCGSSFYETYNGETYTCLDSLGVGCIDWQPETPVATTGIVQSTPTASPTTHCTPHWTYDQLVDKGQAWEVVVNKQEDPNNTASPAQETFVTAVSKTVTVSDEAKLTASTSLEAGVDVYVGVDIGASMTASVKLEVNHSVVQTVVVSVGNSITITVPPHETGYAIYGVKVQVTSGHLYDTNKCEGNHSDVGADVSYVPIAAGWCTWVSDEPDPCPVVSG